MAENEEGLETQNIPEGEAPNAEVALSEEEIADLKHKADVSSQNFERAKKAEIKVKELEERLSLTDNPVLSNEDDSDVSALRTELSEVKGFMLKQQVLDAYPQLKEVWNDFESFRTDPDNAGMSAITAAKAFVIEKDLNTPRRQGLEKPVGGGKRIVPSSGMSNEEAKKLRETDYKKYRDAIKKGLIKFS